MTHGAILCTCRANKDRYAMASHLEDVPDKLPLGKLEKTFDGKGLVGSGRARLRRKMCPSVKKSLPSASLSSPFRSSCKD